MYSKYWLIRRTGGNLTKYCAVLVSLWDWLVKVTMTIRHCCIWHWKVGCTLKLRFFWKILVLVRVYVHVHFCRTPGCIKTELIAWVQCGPFYACILIHFESVTTKGKLCSYFWWSLEFFLCSLASGQQILFPSPFPPLLLFHTLHLCLPLPILFCTYVDPRVRTSEAHGKQHLLHLAVVTDGTDLQFRSVMTHIELRLTRYAWDRD